MLQYVGQSSSRGAVTSTSKGHKPEGNGRAEGAIMGMGLNAQGLVKHDWSDFSTVVYTSALMRIVWVVPKLKKVSKILMFTLPVRICELHFIVYGAVVYISV